MDNLALRRYEMLKRVRDFSLTNHQAFAEGSLGKELFTAIAGIVSDLDAHGANQISGKSAAQSQTATKAALREDLREALATLNRTARVMAMETPGLDDKFRLPRTNNDQVLLNAARAFIADAQAHKEAFVKHELPADFLERLTQQINGFEQALTQQSAAISAKVAAKTAIDETIGRGLQTVRQLDVVIRNKFNGDAVMLAAWARASHVERRSYNSAPEKTEKEPTTPTATPTS
ncbi:MAG TPA: hypothetical protein PKC13_25780 [Blastocatellia bacterium]|nr:hypothetical protein [Blastocatellia bacterium]HMX29022.1 hypothetical protein [Blastocatellia bacterium]HNG28331.1 hypothetical protein [Blastocatellia bacterium]